MVLVRLGALRFHGLIADFGSLPIDATLIGGIFDATDTIQKFVFDGSAWVEFVSGTGEDNTGANVGVGTGNVFRDKTGVTLNFKTLIGGTNIVVTDNADDITLSSTGTSPLTTKGDLFGFSTVDDRFPVGVDGQVIQADSSQAVGLKYIDLLFTKGQLLTFDTGLTQIGVGTNDQVLTADSAIASGLKWADATGGGGITGLNPDSTILEYLNTVSTVFTDYTTPTAVIATSGQTGLTILDDYTNASLWVQTGTTVTVDSGVVDKMAAISTVSSGTDRVTRDLGFVYSTDFILEWTANVSAVTTTNGVYMIGYTSDDTVFASGTDGVAPLIQSTGGLAIQLQHISNGTVAGASSITLGAGLLNTDLFYRVTRVGNLFTLTIFSDSARTIPVGTGTSSFTTALTDFRFVYHGARGPGGDATSASWTVDDLDLFLTDESNADNAIDGEISTFWESLAGIGEAIELDMGSVVNMYGLAYFLSTDAGMTETQFQIKVPAGGDIANGVLTYYDFQQTSGDLLDQSGVISSPDALNLDGTNTNVTQTATGILGNAYTYNGTTSTTVIQNSQASALNFDGTTPFSVGFWYKSTATLVGQFIGNFGGQVGWGLFLNSDDGIAFRLSNILATDALRGSLTDATRNDGNYHYLVWTYDGSQTIAGCHLYFDNIDKTLGTTTDNLVSSTVSPNGVEMGSRNNQADQFYAGELDELAVWNREITAIEVATLFNNGNGLRIPNFGAADAILRTINLSDMTLDAWNFIRFNGINTQFLTIQGSSGGTLVMAANELAVQLETDPPLTTLHGQFTINGTNENLPFNGGDPTTSVIDDPSTNSMTLVNTVTQNDPVPGAGVLWVETVDANNDGLFMKIKIDGSFQTVRVV